MQQELKEESLLPDYVVAIISGIAFIIVLAFSAYHGTTDQQYKQGQILYPDYVHTDTLVVTDANKLNWRFENLSMATDEDISEALMDCTEVYKGE